MHRHPLDIVSLLFGVMFLVIAGTTAAGIGLWSPGSRWYLPVTLIAVGAIGLIATTLRRSSRSGNDDSTESVRE